MTSAQGEQLPLVTSFTRAPSAVPFIAAMAWLRACKYLPLIILDVGVLEQKFEKQPFQQTPICIALRRENAEEE